MKKYLSFVLIVAMFMLVGGRFTLADTVSTSSTNTLQQNLEARRAALKSEVETKTKEFQASLQAEKDAFKIQLKNDVAAFKANIKTARSSFRANASQILSTRFQEAVKNISSLQDRVSSRISTLKAAGKDTSSAEAFLADSKLKLSDAETKLNQVQALIPATDSQVTADVYSQIKQGARDTQDLIKQSRQSLVEAVNVLKGLSPVVNQENSSDKSSSSTSSTQTETNTGSNQ